MVHIPYIDPMGMGMTPKSWTFSGLKRHGQDVADSIELEDESQHTQLLVGEQPPRVRLGSPELLPAAWPEGCEDEGSEREEDDQDDQAVEKAGEDDEAEEAEEEVEEIEEVEGEEGEEEECTEEQRGDFVGQ